jgi:rhodanese-related sulfurtransferase
MQCIFARCTGDSKNSRQPEKRKETRCVTAKIYNDLKLEECVMPKQIEGEPYVRISVDEAADLHGNDDVVFVDVRRTDEYIEGHVEGALFITVDDVLGRIDELPRDKNLLFICAAGVRSGLACEMAAAMGYDSSKLYNIEEGTPTWIERGYPTSQGTDL